MIRTRSSTCTFDSYRYFPQTLVANIRHRHGISSGSKVCPYQNHATPASSPIVSPSKLPARERPASFPTSFNVPPPSLLGLGAALVLLLVVAEVELGGPALVVIPVESVFIANIGEEVEVADGGEVSLILVVSLKNITGAEAADMVLSVDDAVDEKLEGRPAAVGFAVSPPSCVGSPYRTDPPPTITGNT